MKMTENLALKIAAPIPDIEKYDSFLFIGATGLGKTHLSSSVACSLIEKGAYVVYETSLKLFGDYEMRRFGSSGYTDDESDDIIDDSQLYFMLRSADHR